MTPISGTKQSKSTNKPSTSTAEKIRADGGFQQFVNSFTESDSNDEFEPPFVKQNQQADFYNLINSSNTFINNF